MRRPVAVLIMALAIFASATYIGVIFPPGRSVAQDIILRPSSAEHGVQAQGGNQGGSQSGNRIQFSGASAPVTLQVEDAAPTSPAPGPTSNPAPAPTSAPKPTPTPAPASASKQATTTATDTDTVKINVWVEGSDPRVDISFPSTLTKTNNVSVDVRVVKEGREQYATSPPPRS